MGKGCHPLYNIYGESFKESTTYVLKKVKVL